MIQNNKKTKNISKNTRMKISFVLTKQQKIIWGAFLFILGIALFLSFISYLFSWKADQDIIGDFTIRENITQNIKLSGTQYLDMATHTGSVVD